MPIVSYVYPEHSWRPLRDKADADRVLLSALQTIAAASAAGAPMPRELGGCSPYPLTETIRRTLVIGRARGWYPPPAPPARPVPVPIPSPPPVAVHPVRHPAPPMNAAALTAEDAARTGDTMKRDTAATPPARLNPRLRALLAASPLGRRCLSDMAKER